VELPPASSKDFTESEQASKLAYDGGLLKLRRDEVRLPDGKPAWREYVEHPGAVMVFAIPEAGRVLLERQYRYPLRRHFIELPAGKREPDEDPLITAQRELIEECGFEAARWKHLATLHPCIGYSTEVIDLYEARDLRHVGAQLDEGEHLEVFSATIEAAVAWVGEGLITDTKTAFGLLWYARFGDPAKTRDRPRFSESG
jgi:ADP-ribose pyrophosphatase